MTVNAKDPRVQRTRQLLLQAFAALLEERHNFHSISMQEITQRATVNRATFYAHFEDKPALDPYWMQINTARSFVLGSLLTAIMGPRGRLMAWAGRPWASWQTPEGDQEGIHTFLRRAIALRRGLARDFLVFGRMCRPAAIGEIKQISWLSGQRLHCLPAVFHARWRTHDGRMALALANWTAEEQLVHLDASQLTASPLRYSVQSDGLTTIAYDPSVSLTLVLPPLSVGLLEYEERK